MKWKIKWFFFFRSFVCIPTSFFSLFSICGRRMRMVSRVQYSPQFFFCSCCCCRQLELTNSRSDASFRFSPSLLLLLLCSERRTIIINIKICAICYMCMGFNEASEKTILNVNWSLKRIFFFMKDSNFLILYCRKWYIQQKMLKTMAFNNNGIQHTNCRNERNQTTKWESIYVDIACNIIYCLLSWVLEKLRRKIFCYGHDNTQQQSLYRHIFVALFYMGIYLFKINIFFVNVCALLYLHPIWSIMYEIYALCTLHLRQMAFTFCYSKCVVFVEMKIVGFHILAISGHIHAIHSVHIYPHIL